MTGVQLRQLYDDNPDITVEMLANNFGYEVEAVKLELAAGSKRFRKEIKKDDEVFSNDEFDIARKALVNLIRDSDVDAVKYRAATFVINEHLGRNKLANAKNMSGNINIVNIHIKQAREALAKAKEQNVVIDVETAKQLREAEAA